MDLLRGALERSAESARQLRTRLANGPTSATRNCSATETLATTPSTATPVDSNSAASTSPQLPPAVKPLAHKSIPSAATSNNVARLTQLVGENQSARSLARVVKRKYQSVARERARIEMLSSNDNTSTSSSHDHLPSAAGDRPASHSELIDAVEQYDVEFPKLVDTSLGIELETDFYNKHTVIKHVRSGSIAAALAASTPGVLCPGHVVVALNDRDLSQLSFEQVLATLKQAADAPRVIRFADPAVLPMKLFQFEHKLVNRDQYGFAKDDAYMRSYRKQLRKRKSLSYPHEKKWTDFVQRVGGLDALDERVNNEHNDASTDAVLQELRALVLSGIPVVLRPRIWHILTGVTAYKRKFGADYFAQLVADRDSSPSVADIEKDVCRTYPEHPFFQTEKGKRELKNVLCAYSLHNASVGYCQAMNFIAGMLLLFMDEADAFWILCVLLHKKYLCTENYAQSMVGTQTDQRVFQWLVESQVPAVAAKLEHDGIHIQLVTLHWFLCAFVCTLPTETALRVWDWFFLDGEHVLFTVAIGILQLAQDRILRAKTHSDLHTIVRSLGTDLHDEDALIRSLVDALAAGAHQNDASVATDADWTGYGSQKLDDARRGSVAEAAASDVAPRTMSMPASSVVRSPRPREQPVAASDTASIPTVSAVFGRSQPVKLFQQFFQSTPSSTTATTSMEANRAGDKDKLEREQRAAVHRITFTMDTIEQKRTEYRREIEAAMQQQQSAKRSTSSVVP